MMMMMIMMITMMMIHLYSVFPSGTKTLHKRESKIKNYKLPNYLYKNKILFIKSTIAIKSNVPCKPGKNKCLSFRLKVSANCKSFNDCGREFHNTSEAKANDRPP